MNNYIIILLQVIFLCFMLQGAIVDWNSRLVLDRTWIICSVLSLAIAILKGYTLINILKYSSWLFIMFIVTNLITLSLNGSLGVGGGDIKIAPAVTLFYGSLGAYIMCIILLLSLIGQFIFKKISDKKEAEFIDYIPMVTYFFVGCVIYFIIYII